MTILRKRKDTVEAVISHSSHLAMQSLGFIKYHFKCHVLELYLFISNVNSSPFERHFYFVAVLNVLTFKKWIFCFWADFYFTSFLNRQFSVVLWDQTWWSRSREHNLTSRRCRHLCTKFRHRVHSHTTDTWSRPRQQTSRFTLKRQHKEEHTRGSL